MIRNLDRLTSEQDDNVRVYKSTPSYEHIKLTSDNISNVLDFASAIEQFQNMHKISVPAASLVSADIREYLIGVADNPRVNSMTFFGLDNTSAFSLLQKLKRPKNTLEFRRAMSRYHYDSLHHCRTLHSPYHPPLCPPLKQHAHLRRTTLHHPQLLSPKLNARTDYYSKNDI